MSTTKIDKLINYHDSYLDLICHYSSFEKKYFFHFLKLTSGTNGRKHP